MSGRYLDPLLECWGEVLASGHRHFPRIVVGHDGSRHLRKPVIHQLGGLFRLDHLLELRNENKMRTIITLNSHETREAGNL